MYSNFYIKLDTVNTQAVAVHAMSPPVYQVPGKMGGFQLEFLSINWVINHMTCYKFECSHWWKIYF